MKKFPSPECRDELKGKGAVDAGESPGKWM